MTMLDDARPGMNPDIRPQDDLFGHVNGRWLDETEIPADRSAWGSFTVLADTAEEHVRQIIEELAQSGHEPGSNEQKIGDLFASFMDEERVEALGAEPIRADLEKVGALGDKDALVAFVGSLERQGGGGFFAAYVNTDDRDSDRYLVNVLQGGLGLPDESYYREDKFAEIRTAYLAHLERMFALAGLDDAAGAAARVVAVETRLAEGHWDRAATRDVIKTYNLRSLADLKEAAPAFDVGRLGDRTRRRRADAGRGDRPAAVLLRAPLDRPGRGRPRGLEGLGGDPGRPGLGAVPLLGLRRRELRVLRQDPQRHPRAAGPLEARRRVRGGCDRRGGRRGVRRPALPAARQGDDGRAGRQPARGLSPQHRGAGLDERGDQGSAPSASWRPSAPRSATPRSSATTPRSRCSPTT